MSTSSVRLLAFGITPGRRINEHRTRFILHNAKIRDVPFQIMRLNSRPRVLMGVRSGLLSGRTRAFAVGIATGMRCALRGRRG